MVLLVREGLYSARRQGTYQVHRPGRWQTLAKARLGAIHLDLAEVNRHPAGVVAASHAVMADGGAGWCSQSAGGLAFVIFFQTRNSPD